MAFSGPGREEYNYFVDYDGDGKKNTTLTVLFYRYAKSIFVPIPSCYFNLPQATLGNRILVE